MVQDIDHGVGGIQFEGEGEIPKNTNATALKCQELELTVCSINVPAFQCYQTDFKCFRLQGASDSIVERIVRTKK